MLFIIGVRHLVVQAKLARRWPFTANTFMLSTSVRSHKNVLITQLALSSIYVILALPEGHEPIIIIHHEHTQEKIQQKNSDLQRTKVRV
jgi:hypothetical protein